jgi:eukaryotic-like serine/threonine-protein kinase
MANDMARRTDDDLEPEIEISDSEDSLVVDRNPKPAALQRLGRYRVVCELASGGMATVNLAIADGLDKLLALKVIHPHLAKEEPFVRMFLDEARIASSVSHRNVCNVFDYGEQDGRYYMAMDYLAGSTLRDVIRRLRGKRSKMSNGALAVHMAYIIAQAAEGLHAAHELRGNQGELLEVVHRDVSPHNLFVTYDGDVSVVDFGIARASDRLQQTATGVLKGKFSYMAPEQIRQTRVDRRADIWSLGVCLWEALTQRRLFVRATQADTLMSVMMDAIKLPSEVDNALPAALDQIVLRALARNPDERYRTAREMSRDLMTFVRDSGASIGPMEIEHFMEELFPKEMVQSKELVRRAKQMAAEDFIEHSLSMPIPTHTGAMLRPSMQRALAAAGRTATGATPVSAVGFTNYAGSFPPEAELGAARDTALPMQQPRGSRGFLWGVVAAAAAAGVAFVALPRETLLSHKEVPAVQMDAEPPHVAQPAPAPAAIAADPGLQRAAPPPSVAAREPAPSVEALPTPDRGMPATQLRSVPSPQARSNGSRNGASRSRNSHEAPDAAAAEPALSRSEPRPSLEIDAATEHHVEAEVRVEPKAAAEPLVVAPLPSNLPKPAAAPERPALPKPDTRPLDANAAFANIQTQGSLGSGIVSRMLGRSAPLLRTCYQSAARAAGRNDFASIKVSFNIDEAGGVRASEVSSHALPGLSSCVNDALRRVRSDQKPDVGTVKVEAQVSFRPM